jgi:hypothetical protein
MLGVIVLAAAAFAIVFAAASSANLSGSPFESTDGNKTVDNTCNSVTVGGQTVACEDWNGVNDSSKLATRSDLTNSSADDAFGQGTKEDDPDVTVVQGSIPPQKSDLSKFYAYSEKLNGITFLYLAWERTNNLGSANMDFELNQVSTDFKVTAGGATVGKYTINRTAGDLLVTYDFGGSGVPQTGLNRWVIDATHPANVPGFSTNTCYKANSFPCWGDHVDLTSAGAADGSISADNKFGETAINLTVALPDVFGSGATKCESIGSAYLKSRSSSAFTAEIKDFIAPQTTQVSNCGSILIKKTDDSATPVALTGATFTITPGSTDSSGVQDPGPTTIPAVSGKDGYYCIDNLLLNQSGGYSVKETVAPTGYNPPSPDTKTGLTPAASTCADRFTSSSTPTATWTFVDTLQLGALKVVKTAKDKSCTGSPLPAGCASAGHKYLSGVSFGIYQDNVQVGSSVSTTSSGVACFPNLKPGSYNVRETAPTGYSGAANHDVTVVASTAPSSCVSGATRDDVSNTPLSKIEVKFVSTITGATTAVITCKDEAGTTISADAGGTSGVDQSYSGLPPNTDANHNYTCTVNIDP